MRNLNHNSKLPVYIIQESPEYMKIAYNLTGGSSSDMEMYLSQDHSRLHVVGKKFFDNVVNEFLWTFSLPKNVDCPKIEMEKRNDFYVISVPKKGFLARTISKFILHSNLQTACAI